MTVTARQNATQEVHYIRANVAFNTAASGTQVSMGSALPANAVVLFTSIAVQTVFNGTTPVLIVGTAADDDALVAAAGADETAVGVTNVVPATLGGIMSSSADVELFWKLTVGGSPTTGAATITVAYVPNV